MGIGSKLLANADIRNQFCKLYLKRHAPLRGAADDYFGGIDTQGSVEAPQPWALIRNGVAVVDSIAIRAFTFLASIHYALLSQRDCVIKPRVVTRNARLPWDKRTPIPPFRRPATRGRQLCELRSAMTRAVA